MIHRLEAVDNELFGFTSVYKSIDLALESSGFLKHINQVHVKD